MPIAAYCVVTATALSFRLVDADVEGGASHPSAWTLPKATAEGTDSGFLVQSMPQQPKFVEAQLVSPVEELLRGLHCVPEHQRLNGKLVCMFVGIQHVDMCFRQHLQDGSSDLRVLRDLRDVHQHPHTHRETASGWLSVRPKGLPLSGV